MEPFRWIFQNWHLLFFFTITCITDSVVSEGKLSWSNIQRIGLSYRLRSHEHPKMWNQNLWLFVVETNLEWIISFISKQMAYDGFDLPFLLFLGTLTIKICKNYLHHICTSLCVKQLKKNFMTLYINTFKIC
jgi:hypothetical protein